MSTETVPAKTVKYPGQLMAIDGNTAVVLVETAASEAAGSYPISPSSQMGEGFADAMAQGKLNAFGRPLIFIEPEGEHAAAGVTAGMSMVGLRSANFSSGQGVAYMHESLYAAAGKRLTYVLNVGARAITKQSLNVHAGHDDFHCADDTGFFQVFGKNAQQAADLCLIAHRTAELSLTPGINAMDGWLTTHLLETARVPEAELVAEYLGSPDDIIDCPTPAQRMIFGPTRRRVPCSWDVDNPAQLGVVQNQDSYAQGVAAQRPFFFDHIEELANQAMAEYAALTGRVYDQVIEYRTEDAEYLIVGFGSMTDNAEAVVDYLRESRGLKVGVVQVIWFRPFPGARLARVLKGRKGVAVLERTDQPLACDQPLVREVRAALSKAYENGLHLSRNEGGGVAHEGYPALHKPEDLPLLYSGSYGLGSRDLQPSQLIGAIENMMPGGKGKRVYYLGIEFVQENPPSEARKHYQKQLLADYPHLADLAIQGSENPSLLPEGAVAVRMHSIGGWGAITTGKNLTGTLFDLLDLHVKSNPKYGGEKKGTPTTYYAAFANERIRINYELRSIDVVLSPDPNVFRHTHALAGLKEGGHIVIQSIPGGPEAVWSQFPDWARKVLEEKSLRVWYLDAFGISKEEATNPDLELRMQGTVFQGAFFRVSPLVKQHGLDENRLFDSIEGVLDSKFGSKGKSVVADNLRAVRRGYDEVQELDWRSIDAAYKEPLKAQKPKAAETASPGTQTPLTQADRFYEQVGRFYAEGSGSDGIADPFVSLSFVPAVTGTFRDMTQIRFEFPEFIPENCTGCAKCWTQCPDSAIPGLVVEIDSLLDKVAARLNGGGSALAKHREAVGTALRVRLEESGETPNVADLAHETICAVATEVEDPSLAQEAEAVKAALVDLPLAKTKPFFVAPERKEEGAGALLAITVNPTTCKGCMECVDVCDDDALRPVPQTDADVERLRRGWDLWEDLPDTAAKYIKINDLDSAAGVLSSLLLNKTNYYANVGGDGACMGCGEKTPIHLLCASAEALMQPRVAEQIERVQGLTTQIDELLGSLSGPEDTARIERLQAARGVMEDLAWRYQSGPTGKGRTTMGMVNNTGCTTVWGSTYPYNPYPFPWVNHLFQDGPSVAMGVFEGHMRKMADGFRAIRVAKLELAGEYDPTTHDRFFELFGWQDFTDEEYRMCPPLIVLGGDGSMLDIGFQNLSRMLMSGRPIKVLIVDTQVYSNTGGQICTSGFIGQVSDMATYGEFQKGKVEPRKEIGLIGIAHRGVFTAQTSAAHTNHMIKSFLLGLNSRRPAVFSAFTTCQPEHGVADDSSARQAKLALEGRAFPFFMYDPDGGETFADRLTLAMNPSVKTDWPSYKLEYVDDQGESQSMKVPMTFADFAATEGRFGKHFGPIPADEMDDEKYVLFSDYLAATDEEREGKNPFLWVTDREQKLTKIKVGNAIVDSAQERLDFWHMLQELAGVK